MSTRSINPIIPGFAPDPSCIRVDDTYYLVNSAFQYFPNLPIYTSKDLVNWTHTTNAINRREQLSFAYSFTRVNPPDQWGESMLASGGLYAPTIRYHAGTFYVVCTNVIQKHQDGKTDERQNFSVTSTDPFKDEWSDPVFFDFDGIDVSPFWDETGKSYIVGSAVPGPMTTIKLFEIDLNTGKKLSDERLIWRGTGGVYPEGPHIYVRDGYHYLVISEGGCFEDHMITAARSKDLWGPYEAYEHNPLVTARNPKEYVRHIGHSDMFTDNSGNWWLVLLGVRKDDKGRYLMGRETFLTPMSWPDNSWPVITQPRIDPTLPEPHHLPSPSTSSISANNPQTEYIYLRDADLTAYQVTNNAQTITLQPTSADITNADPAVKPTFLTKRIRSLEGGASTATLHLPRTVNNDSTSTSTSTSPGIKAGIALYKDEHRFARLYYSTSRQELVFELRNAGKSISRDAATSVVFPQDTQQGETRKIKLRVTYSEQSIELSYAVIDGGSDNNEEEQQQKQQWINLGGEIDSLELTGLDFTGPVVGVFACYDDDEAAATADGADAASTTPPVLKTETLAEKQKQETEEQLVVFEEFVVQ